MPVREDWNRINNIRSSRVSILSGGDAPTAPFALLVACYNRLPITKAFFLNLQQQLAACAPGILDVYVFDDGSSDGTAEAILSIYPRAVILRGDGNFFWSASMSYLCHSIDARRYAGVMLVNDDIKLYDGALDDAIKAFGRVNAVGPTCLVGSFLAPDRSTITYSGWIRTESSPSPFSLTRLPPNAEDRRCDTFNANFVIIPGKALAGTSGIDPMFTQGFGDIDLGYRLVRAGVGIVVHDKPMGECDANLVWKRIMRTGSFKQRWRLAWGPHRSPRDYARMAMRFAPLLAPLLILKDRLYRVRSAVFRPSASDDD